MIEMISVHGPIVYLNQTTADGRVIHDLQIRTVPVPVYRDGRCVGMLDEVTAPDVTGAIWAGGMLLEAVFTVGARTVTVAPELDTMTVQKIPEATGTGDLPGVTRVLLEVVTAGLCGVAILDGSGRSPWPGTCLHRRVG